MYKYVAPSIDGSPAGIQRVADGAFIPLDPMNTDFRAFQEWRAAGNIPAPADPPAVIVPQEVTNFQAQVALHEFGYLPQVEALMQHPDTPFVAKLAWKTAQVFERSSPNVASMAAALGLSEQQLDELFTYAATVKA